MATRRVETYDRTGALVGTRDVSVPDVVISNGEDVYLHDLTLEGPPAPLGNNDAGILIKAGGRDHVVRLERVKITGEWSHGIYVEAGDAGSTGRLVLELVDCDITGNVAAVSMFAEPGAVKALHARNCVFHDTGDTGAGHLLYIHPHVAVDLDNCRFAGNSHYAFHHYGSPDPEPAYVRLRACWFAPSTSDGILTTSRGRTLIDNCMFEGSGRGVVARNHTVITASVFKSPVGVTTYGPRAGATVTIDNCVFDISTSMGVDTGSGEPTFLVSDCDFRLLTGDSGYGVQVWDAKAVITGCRFAGMGAGSGVGAQTGADVQVRGCDFEGRFTHDSGAVRLMGTPEAVLLDGCTFKVTRGVPVSPPSMPMLRTRDCEKFENGAWSELAA